MEAFRSGQSGVPLDTPRPARLADVLAFLHEDTDDDKLSALVWALPAVNWSSVEFQLPEQTALDDLDLPCEFGVPRLLVEALPLVANRGYWQFSATGEPIAPDPDVFNALAAGQANAVATCVDRAARRLRSGGRLVTGYRNRVLVGKSLNVVSSFRPDRLLAAMLFPLSKPDLERIANKVLFPPDFEE